LQININYQQVNYVTYLMEKQNHTKVGKFTMESNVDDLLKFLLSESDQIKIGPSKSYRRKEELMQVVQDSIRAYSELIESQAEYEDIVDQEIQKLREDLDLTLSMIGRTLYQVPFQVFKTPNPNK
jgi:hypothetical protein